MGSMVRLYSRLLVTVLLVTSVVGSLDHSCTGDQESNMVGKGELDSCKASDGAKSRVALVMGATGETGKEVLRHLVMSPEFSSIVSIGRRKLELPDESSYDKVVQKIVDFDNLDSHETDFKGIDQAFCCLGTTRSKSGPDGFVKVDHAYVLSAAKLLKKNDCSDFHLLTSKGSIANSWFLYPSTKGKTENDVTALGFDHLSIYRPGLLLCERENGRFFEGLLQSLARHTDGSSWWSIPTEMVARAMVQNSLETDKKSLEIIEHDKIVHIAQQN